MTQTQIPGTEPTTIPDVNKAAAAFIAARQGKKNATDAENKARDRLVFQMKKHDLKTYRDAEEGLVITLDGKDVVKVTKPKKAKPRSPRRK